MTEQDRVKAVVTHGYTERQARFLVLVMLHSGVCTVRQYCQFAGITRGQKSQDFFAGLVAAKHASASMDANGKLRVFHVYASTLYDAIGEPNNRNRKAVPIAAAIERIMLLDSVLACQELTWLATEREKLAHFTTTLGQSFRRCDLPHLTFGTPPNVTTRFFHDKLPIGLAPTDETVFPYLVRRPSPVDFRSFLNGHAELLRSLPRWRLRLVVPRHLLKSEGAYLNAVRDELLSPLRPSVVDELKWYFGEKSKGWATAGSDESQRFRSARQAFDSPRFNTLYRRWVEMGPRALEALSSPSLADAVARGKGHVETHVLGHSYFRLQSMVGTA